ncbi:hypothetical protein BKA69DRAFT_723511 [Paraphysoderma sedebokerense]|nr:hypothetical protein BKA69DRAFT_723511 [Paraphysoderma sedebokerense]
MIQDRMIFLTVDYVPHKHNTEMKVPSIPQLSSLGDFANTKNGSSQAVGQLVSIISGLFFLFVFPVLVVCSLPFAAFLSPILIPITLIIGGNPVPWIVGFCTDSVTRTWDFIGTLGPRIFDRSAPHPSYVHDGEFPTVENVPWSQRGDFALFRISNYFRKMAISLITATYKALFDYKAQPISDEEMGQVYFLHQHILQIP